MYTASQNLDLITARVIRKTVLFTAEIVKFVAFYESFVMHARSLENIWRLFEIIRKRH